METTLRTAPRLVTFIEEDSSAPLVLLRCGLGLHDHPAEGALRQHVNALPLVGGILMPREHVRDRAQEVDLRGHQCDRVRAGLSERFLRMNETRRDDFLPTVWCREAFLLSAGGEAAGGCALQEGNVELRMEASGGRDE